MTRRRMAKEIFLGIITLFLAWVFIRQGMSKFSDTSGWAQAFRIWHYPVWFRVIVGVAEVTAALLILVPRTASAGALLILAVMAGAMTTHISRGHPQQITSEILPVVLATTIFFMRRQHARAIHTRTRNNANA